jgi:hypothetical protein
VHAEKPVNAESASIMNSNGSSMNHRSGGSTTPNKLIQFNEEKIAHF